MEWNLFTQYLDLSIFHWTSPGRRGGAADREEQVEISVSCLHSLWGLPGLAGSCPAMFSLVENCRLCERETIFGRSFSSSGSS